MVPFRVFDRDNKQMWTVLNFHPNGQGEGTYLATKEDDSDTDGDMRLIPVKDLVKFRFVDFLEESEPFEG